MESRSIRTARSQDVWDADVSINQNRVGLRGAEDQARAALEELVSINQNRVGLRGQTTKGGW